VKLPQEVLTKAGEGVIGQGFSGGKEVLRQAKQLLRDLVE